jgi:hypothetical protein
MLKLELEGRREKVCGERPADSHPVIGFCEHSAQHVARRSRMTTSITLSVGSMSLVN